MPLASVDAVHVSLMAVLDSTCAARFVGTVGGVVSGAVLVFALAIAELETFAGFALSTAKIVYEYVVLEVRPVSEYSKALPGRIFGSVANAGRRVMRYSRMPLVSDEAVQFRRIDVVPVVVAVKLP